MDMLGAAVGLHTFPSVLKEAMWLAGFAAGDCRKPVGGVPEPSRRKLEAVIERLKGADYLA